MITSKARIAAVVTTAAFTMGIAAGPAAAGGNVVKVRDACDPATFNEALGEGACVRGDEGGPRVTFDRLIQRAMKTGQHNQWSFTDKLKLEPGESFVVRFDRGGETHSFTSVAQFGGGCVDEINAVVGLTPVAECPAAFGGLGSPETGPGPDYIGPAQRELHRTAGSPGVYRFMCIIHPWMRTTVSVEDDG